jgi:hypothetical protein
VDRFRISDFSCLEADVFDSRRVSAEFCHPNQDDLRVLAILIMAANRITNLGLELALIFRFGKDPRPERPGGQFSVGRFPTTNINSFITHG